LAGRPASTELAKPISDAIEKFAAEIEDRFGAIPEEVLYLLALARLAQARKPLGIAKDRRGSASGRVCATCVQLALLSPAVGGPNDVPGLSQRRFARPNYRLFVHTARQGQVTLGVRRENEIHGRAPVTSLRFLYNARCLMVQRGSEVLPLKIFS
jgi:hypothetical protein